MLPWYGWLAAALPIGGAIAYYILRQTQKAQVEQTKRANAEGWIKSEIEVKKAEENIGNATDAAIKNPNPDLGRW